MKNNYIIITVVLVLIAFFSVPVASLAQAGSLDLSFDTDGIATTQIGNSGDDGKAMAIQNDGKILVAGTSNNGPIDYFALVRYNTDGSLDSTFDNDGIVTTAVGSSHDYGFAVAIQSDGKIVMAGYSDNGFFNHDFAVVRYNTDGSLDTTFDSDGKVTTAINGTLAEIAYAVVIQSDGKIVAAGYSNNGIDDDFAIVRYNSNGSLDSTFDNDGIVTTPIGTAYDDATSAAIQSDGKIVVAGSTSSGSYADFALVRYNTDGSLDSTFDSDGKVITAIGISSDVANALSIQGDGKIVAAGYSFVGSYADMALIRYNTDGSLDTTFDTDGIVTTTLAATDDFGWAIAIQPNGKIIVAGATSDTVTLASDFILARYNENGSLDITLDTDGIVTSPLGNYDDYGSAVAVQSDGKIVMAGSSYTGNYSSFAVVRYNNDSNVGLNSPDIQAAEIKIYPNPFSTSAIIQTDRNLRNATLAVYNIYGQQVKLITPSTIEAGQYITLNRGNLLSGVYFIQLIPDNNADSKRNLTYKLIIAD